MSEQNILELLRCRSDNAVELLHKHYGPLMRYIIAPILSDERDREECLNDVCLLVWEKHEQYDPDKGSFKGWLSAIARNTALNRARRSISHAYEELDPSVPDTKDGGIFKDDFVHYTPKTNRYVAQCILKQYRERRRTQ